MKKKILWVELQGDHIKHGEVLVDVEIESKPNCLATQLSEL